MPTNQYHRILYSIVIGLTLFVGLFSFILYNQGPRVRIVETSEDLSVRSLTNQATISIRFDRALQQQDYTDQISFYPEVAFSSQTFIQGINIVLDENLDNNTDYTLSIGPEIYDQAGKRMQDSFEYQINTSQARYTILQRQQNSNDRILLTQIGQEPKTMFSHRDIVQYQANGQYIVAVVREANGDAIYKVDIASGESEQIKFLSSARVNDLVMNPRSNLIVYTVSPTNDSRVSQYYELFNDVLQTIDLDSGQGQVLTREDGSYIEARSIEFDQSGQVILMQDIYQSYYAVSPYNDYEPLFLGTHTTTFGFNDNGQAVYFLDLSKVNRYDMDSGEATSIDIFDQTIFRKIEPKGEGLLFLSEEPDAATTRSSINLIDPWDAENYSELWSSTDVRVQNFSVNYDNSTLAIELDPSPCTYDDLHPNTKCIQTQTLLFDVESSSVINQIDGFDLIWLP